MNTLREKLVKFLKSEDGPTAVEYAVMVALIIVVSIAAITTLGTKVSSTFSSTATAITAAVTPYAVDINVGETGAGAAAFEQVGLEPAAMLVGPSR